MGTRARNVAERMAVTRFGVTNCAQNSRGLRYKGLQSPNEGRKAMTRDQSRQVPQQTEERELLDKAASGDTTALPQLLLEHYDQLSEHIASRIPTSLQGVVSADDIIQQALIKAIREIGHFTPQADQSFHAWLKTIAENCTKDAIRRLKSAKRGGNHRQIQTHALEQGSSVADLVDLLSAGSHTPSGSAARHEAVAAVQHAINSLPEDYRQAVELRLLAGKSLEETANIMGRSPRAVQGLVDRARKKMRAELGRLSLYE